MNYSATRCSKDAREDKCSSVHSGAKSVQFNPVRNSGVPSFSACQTCFSPFTFPSFLYWALLLSYYSMLFNFATDSFFDTSSLLDLNCVSDPRMVKFDSAIRIDPQSLCVCCEWPRLFHRPQLWLYPKLFLCPSLTLSLNSNMPLDQLWPIDLMTSTLAIISNRSLKYSVLLNGVSYNTRKSQ